MRTILAYILCISFIFAVLGAHRLLASFCQIARNFIMQYCVCDYLAMEMYLMLTIDLFWVDLRVCKISGLSGLSFARFRLRAPRVRPSIN